MADVFLSYARADADRANALAERIRAALGLSVFIDNHIEAGAPSWVKRIEAELAVAKVVLVLWTETSVASEWVSIEAKTGRERGVLAPARLDDVPPPLEFTYVQAADLRGWTGDPADPRLLILFSQIAARARGEAPPAPPSVGGGAPSKKSTGKPARDVKTDQLPVVKAMRRMEQNSRVQTSGNDVWAGVHAALFAGFWAYAFFLNELNASVSDWTWAVPLMATVLWGGGIILSFPLFMIVYLLFWIAPGLLSKGRKEPLYQLNLDLAQAAQALNQRSSVLNRANKDFAEANGFEMTLSEDGQTVTGLGLKQPPTGPQQNPIFAWSAWYWILGIPAVASIPFGFWAP